MFEYFYNEILRRTIISFGTLFNDLEIKQSDSSDNTTSIIKGSFSIWSYSKVFSKT